MGFSGTAKSLTSKCWTVAIEIIVRKILEIQPKYDSLNMTNNQIVIFKAQAQASHLAREHLLTSEKPTENGSNQFSSFSNVSPTGNDGMSHLKMGQK